MRTPVKPRALTEPLGSLTEGTEMKKSLAIAASVLAVGAGALAITGTTPAQAASQITSAMIKDQTIQSGDIGEGGVGASEVRNGALTGTDLNPTTVKRFLAGEKAVQQNADQDAKISSLEDRVEVEETEGDSGAVVSKHLGSDATNIANIGGKFAERATLLDTKHVDAGTYLVTSYAFFDRVDNSQASSPVLQLAVRGIDGSQWGADYGTFFTPEFPSTGNMEQTASGTRLVTVPEGGLDVSVYVFGYNTDTSANGSGNYTVSADVNFVPVG